MTTATVDTEEEEAETKLKWRFAELSLRYPNDPFKAAMQITYGNSIEALQILQNWQFSIEIAKMKEALIESMGEEAFLPSKSEMVREVLNRAERTYDDAVYCKLMALAFDVRGMTSKSQPSVVINNTQTNNKIMQIPVMINQQGALLTDEEWEQSLISQQERLVAVRNE